MNENKISLAWLLRVFFAILLIFAFTAGYYWSHKPVSLSAAMVLAQTISSILVWLFVLWVASAIGTLILPQRIFEGNQITHIALGIGLGLGILALLIFGLGILGLLASWIAWLSLLVTAVLLRKQLKLVFSELRSITLPRPQTTLQKWIWVFGAVLFLFAFVNALSPPTAWDSHVYHLTGPKLYIENGQINHPLNIHYLGFPPLSNMHFLFALLLVGERAVALFHFIFGVLSLILTVEISKRYFGRTVAWHGALIFISIPIVFELIGLPYNDGTLLFYTTASLYVFLRWQEKKSNAWLFPLGLLLGFCVSVKYTAIAVPFAIASLIIWSSRNSGFGEIFRRLGPVTILAFVVSAPYFLKNFYTTGNPFYPFFIENAIYWDEWRSAFYDRPGTGFASTDPMRLVTAPIEATILGIKGKEGFGGPIGPLVFSAIFLLPLAWGYINSTERKTLGYLLAFFGINYTLWLFGLARSGLLLQSRLLMPVFGIMAVMGGLALSRIKTLTNPQLDFHWVLNTVLYINMALLLVTTGSNFIQDNPISVVFGLESRQTFLERRMGLYKIVIDRVNDLPDNARVLFLWEPRSYLCQVDCRPDALLDNFLHQTKYHKRNATEIATNWNSQDITHILLFQAGLETLFEDGGDNIEIQDLAILDDLQTNEMQLVEDFNGAYLLFELREE
ncbi:MAG: phospholipid carrier-dependent glycosyltransferase [Chloroflexi bacterium]|nr:MAG: phospholipid carrier-dependent glycosyltransferase [Chloroflexota bacterium]MBL1193750.1 phospholipid carrier-dependent glycosyltransferase [Chloroflexota bacterium]NOH11043.1 phospholipid carrier-dependent glycosyltransferase [Chloroflexota bacterium]